MNAKERVQASLAHRQPDRVPVDYFQRIVATRNDLGTFASMHNKFVRLAMVRLRLSMGEYLGELPPQVETAFAEAMCPDTEAPARIFLPTRPTLLARESRSASPSSPPARRRKSSSAPAPTAPRAGPPRLRNRSPAATWQAALGPFDTEAGLIEYSAPPARCPPKPIY